MDFVSGVMLLIILVISVAFHEFSHGYVSYLLGDPTPKYDDRLSLNPINHFDPYGFFMLLIMVFYGRGIAWGKPVRINPNYYKKPIYGEFLVAFAGPLMNLILAGLAVLIILIYAKIVGISPFDIFRSNNMFITFFSLFSYVNIGLAVFNLLPIPPLDGFSIVNLISPTLGNWIKQYQTFIFIGFVIFILSPAGNLLTSFLGKISHGVFNFYLSLFSFLI